jgi:hypothetical protein
MPERNLCCSHPISCPGHCNVLDRLKRKLLRSVYVTSTSDLAFITRDDSMQYPERFWANGTSPDVHLQLPWACFDWAHPRGTRCYVLLYRISMRSPLARYRSRQGGSHLSLLCRALISKCGLYHLRVFADCSEHNCLSLPVLTYKQISRYLSSKSNQVGFEVFTAVVMNSIIFWDMTPCSPLSCTRRFRGTYRLHLQSQRNKLIKNQLSSRIICQFLLNLFLRP